MGTPTDPVSMNQYVYGQMNPVSFTDPTGLRPECGDCTRAAEQKGIDEWASHSAEHPIPDPSASVLYASLRDPETSEADRLVAARLLVRYYGQTGLEIVQNWFEGQRLAEEASTWSQVLSHPSESWAEGLPLVPSAVDRFAFQVADKTVFWAEAEIVAHHGLGANPRRCGARTCYDNANLLVPPGRDAWTLGTRIFCRDVCSPGIVRHEGVHVRQWQSIGLSYAIRYPYQAAFNGLKCDNPYERPAYQTGTGECS
jgi:hypothetical protein